jgi:hypothetical protein
MKGSDDREGRVGPAARPTGSGATPHGTHPYVKSRARPPSYFTNCLDDKTCEKRAGTSGGHAANLACRVVSSRRPPAIAAGALGRRHETGDRRQEIGPRRPGRRAGPQTGRRPLPPERGDCRLVSPVSCLVSSSGPPPVSSPGKRPAGGWGRADRTGGEFGRLSHEPVWEWPSSLHDGSLTGPRHGGRTSARPVAAAAPRGAARPRIGVVKSLGCWDWSAAAVARRALPAHRPGRLPGAFGGPESARKPGFEAGFALRCLQRLSGPDLATRRCPERDSRYTSGRSSPILSY